MKLINPLKNKRIIFVKYIAGIGVLATMGFQPGSDTATWGSSPSRNMVSSETGLPAEWDIETGTNIKWTVKLGSQAYGNPVICGSKVFVGTNNQLERNPKYKGDHGVLAAFRESDGKFLWQAVHAKLESGSENDWPLQGICSSPFIEGERIYYVSNRCEVICADTEGFYDSENDGPYKTEENTSEIDADFVWKYDMMAELDVFPHNLATSSPLVVGDLVFVGTSNGVDESHVEIPSPKAPSFIALNKNTGELIWQDASPGENILHGQWSSPAYGVVNGQPQVIFPGGDGWIYALEPKTGKHIWKFDCNPKDAVWELGGMGDRNNIIATPVIFEDKVFIAVGQDPENGESIGHIWAIDATKKGDITQSGLIWHRGNDDFNRSMSTVAIHDGLLYTADLSGFVYCLDAETGNHYWTYDAFAAIWGSPFMADGKVYIGDEDGDVAVLKAGKKMKLLHELNMGNAVYTTPAANNGVLFISNRLKLFAISLNK